MRSRTKSHCLSHLYYQSCDKEIPEHSKKTIRYLGRWMGDSWFQSSIILRKDTKFKATIRSFDQTIQKIRKISSFINYPPRNLRDLEQTCGLLKIKLMRTVRDVATRWNCTQLLQSSSVPTLQFEIDESLNSSTWQELLDCVIKGTGVRCGHFMRIYIPNFSWATAPSSFDDLCYFPLPRPWRLAPPAAVFCSQPLLWFILWFMSLSLRRILALFRGFGPGFRSTWIDIYRSEFWRVQGRIITATCAEVSNLYRPWLCVLSGDLQNIIKRECVKLLRQRRYFWVYWWWFNFRSPRYLHV